MNLRLTQTTGRRAFLRAGLAGAGALALTRALPAAQAADLASANPAIGEDTHVLARLAFGPAAPDRARLRSLGIDGWIAEQLTPERIALPADLQADLDALPTQKLSQYGLLTRYRESLAAGKKDDAGKALRRELVQTVALEDGQARLLRALRSPRQLEEVMTEFWFNHFNVFADKGPIKLLAGNYEREAIRPHAFGRFRDLLGATARHPAMLFYLDNWISVAAGKTLPGGRNSGLNENYARELMELHTLGVDGGYSQKDVTELARMLTGWTYNAQKDAPSVFGFDPKRHDDEPKVWLGQTIAPAGEAEGERALDTLARHPATAKHIGFKLAQTFVADAPPPALVDRLARRFGDTDGDIREVLRTLFASAEFRAPAVRGAKFKTPYRQVVSAVRVAGIAVENALPLRAVLTQAGMPLYGCVTPDGWHDTEEAWLNPDAVARRVNFASTLAAGRLPLGRPFEALVEAPVPDRAMAEDAAPARPTPVRAEPLDAAALLATLGDAISPRTRDAVQQARPELRAALVLGSPDFMRH
ncbi:DUF1800 domain-containing protein [Derxia lacustris]|uniref:DUF1800 domain-containing protein n=1 Tax=Derxia lacustris TaxID=764842 RepID=UPI001F1C1CAB|nr:DUF1800 domain-containing protein [Derxia lacustris]